MYRLIFFFSFFFYLCGLLGYLISPFLILLSIPPFLFLIFYRKERKAIYFFLFTFFGYFLCFLLPKGNTNITSLEGIVISKKEYYYLLLTLKGKFYVSMKNDVPNLFSIVSLKGYSSEISITHYESVFNFKDYLKTQGVFYEFKVKQSEIIFSNPFSSNPIKNYIFQFLDEKSKTFFSALLCGESIYSLEENKALLSLGILSVVSLSGFHLSFLFHIIESILEKRKLKYFPYLELLILFFFLFLSNYKYSIKRIFLSKMLLLIFKKKNISISYLERLSIVAFILLFFEPYSLLSGSFYYPFPLLFSLAFFQNRKKKSKIVFTFSIFLFYLPFRMFQTPAFHFLTPIFNIICIPLSHALFLLSLLLFFIPQIGYLLNILCLSILSACDNIAKIPFSITTGVPNILFLILFYFLVLLSYIFKTYSFDKEFKISQICTILLFTTTFIPDYTNHFEVTFIDVGQGDCTLIRYQKSNLLIDTGGNIKMDIATECLIPYFEKRKITDLDSVIITHPDYDHNGALDSLKKNFAVNQTYTHDDFLSSENHIIDFYGLKIQDFNIFSNSNKEDNNYNSGVYYFSIKQKSFLIMGDAPKEIEEKIIANNSSLNCDVIKLGHHGSNTSSSKNFLTQVNPSLAIISCGENNSYKHPHKETLQTLSSLNIPYIRTDIEGTYTIKC